jgi:hypothetical protein
VPASPISPAFTPSTGLVEVAVLEQDAKVAHGLADRRRFLHKLRGLPWPVSLTTNSKVEHRSPVPWPASAVTHVTVAAAALRTVWRLDSPV